MGVFCVKPLVWLPPPVAFPVLGLMSCPCLATENPSVFEFPTGRNAARERLLLLCYLYLGGAAEHLSLQIQLSPGLCPDLRAGNGAVSLDLLLHGPSWSWVLTPEPIPVPNKQPGGCNQELLIATRSSNSTRSLRR